MSELDKKYEGAKVIIKSLVRFGVIPEDSDNKSYIKIWDAALEAQKLLLDRCLTNGWISVIDEQPECKQGNKILGYGEGYIFDCEFDDGYWTNIGGETFTHWMKRPEPPCAN